MKIALFFIVLVLSSLTSAFAASIYEVKNATANITSADATKARDQAMQAAETKAFDELQERLVSNKYLIQKQKIPFTRINTAVDSIDVVEEKATDKGFKGTYNIVFSAYEVSRIFNIKQIAETKEPEKFLIIPLVAEDGEIKLWKNDWWPVWNDLNHEPLVLPLADLQDIQSLKVEDLAAHHLAGLSKISKRYGTNVIVLLQAQYNSTTHSLEVQLEKIKGKDKTVINYEYPGNATIALDDLYQAAAQDLAYRLQNNKLTADNLTTVLDNDEPPVVQPQPLHQSSPPPATTTSVIPEPYSQDAPGVGFIGQKHASDTPPLTEPVTPAKTTTTTKTKTTTTPKTAAPVSDGNTSEAVVAAPDLLAWQRIRAKISSIPGVTLKIKSLNSGRAYITLTYNTDIEALKNSLSNKGLLAINSGTNLAIKEK